MDYQFSSESDIKRILETPSGVRHEYVDALVRGLMLVRRKTGEPQWVLKYICPQLATLQVYKMGRVDRMSLYEARSMALARIQSDGTQPEATGLQKQLNRLDENKPLERFRGQNAKVSEDFNSFKNKELSKDEKVIGTEVTKVELQATEAHQVNPVNLSKEPKEPKESISNQPADNAQILSLRRFVDEHYLPFAKVHKRSVNTDISILNNHVLPALGRCELQQLSTSQILIMIKGMKEKRLANATCNRALILTRFMFNCAIKWGVLPSALENPCRHVKEMVENNKKERFLNSAEVQALKRELAKSRNKLLPYIIQLMILTGCRRGEALNAKLVHFDFGRGDWVVPLPKGGKARHIPLNDLAIQTVRATVAFKQSLVGIARNSEYLFPSPITGEPFRQIHYSWDKARRAANLEEVRMHDLRHSFASALVNSGMTLYDVKQILGHTNIKTTERYAHLSNQRLKAAAASVVSFYGEQNWIGPTVPTVSSG